MKEEHRIWVLFAAKMTNEISEEELLELQQLMQKHPELYYSMELISNLWNSKKTANSHESEDAFHRHLHRMAIREKK